MPRGGDITVRFKAKPGKQEIRQTAIWQVTHGPGVRADLRRRAQNVMNAQKRKVGVKSGALRASIRIVDRGNRGMGGANIQVVAGRPGMKQTGFQEYGTQAHAINPRGPGYPLRFYWAKVGAVVEFMHVWHPGTKPTRFIRDSTRYWRP